MSFSLSEADQLKIINKSAQVGNAHRLLPLKSITDTAIETWEHCFTGNLSDQEAMKMEAFHFLWRKGDVGKVATIPFRGVAANVTQLVYLMADNRIFRESVGLEVSEWLELMKLEVFQMETKLASGGDPAVAKTSDVLKKNLDKVVNFITTDYYKADKPGEATEAYFKDAKESRKAIDKVYKNAQLYLLEDLCPSFEDGAYENWASVMKAIRRFFGKDECQETMIDRFKTLREIVKSNKRMETKVIKFREFLRKFMVDSKDEKDWIKGRDFPDDKRAFQTAPERYSPAFATLFQYIIFCEKIPYADWEKVQTTYHGFLKEPTYRNWHEQRPELYKIMDRAMKKSESINGMSEQEPEINYFSRSGGKGKQVPKRKEKGKEWKSQKSKSYGSSNSNSRQFAKRKSDKGKLSPKLQKYKCNRCSRFAGRPIAHKGPYGGGANSNCLYNKKGKRRNGYEAINKADEDDDEDEDESDSDSDESESDNGMKAADEEVDESDSDDGNSEDDPDHFLYHVKEGSYLPTFREANGKAPLGAYE